MNGVKRRAPTISDDVQFVRGAYLATLVLSRGIQRTLPVVQVVRACKTATTTNDACNHGEVPGLYKPSAQDLAFQSIPNSNRICETNLVKKTFR